MAMRFLQDMMFDEMPAPFMNRNAPSTASGRGMVTQDAAEMHRNSTCAVLPESALHQRMARVSTA